ncbi:hypothetical protein IFM89_018538, partial [Coptis chinensis]
KLVRSPPFTPSVLLARSFEKQLSTGPALTCFHINENTSTSEENKNLEEVLHLLYERIRPRDTSLSNRRPLVDVINNKILPSISVAKNRDRGSIESVNMGEVVSKLYLCENLSLVNDRCFAITFDRTTCVPLILACRKGRTSIEDQAEKFPDIITKVPIGVFKGITEATKVTGGLDPKAADRGVSMKQVKKLYKPFVQKEIFAFHYSSQEDPRAITAA